MELRRRIVFLINPIAGTRTKEGLEKFLARKCHEHQMDFMMVQSTKGMTDEILKMHLYDFNATDLVACGGDGTVNLAAKAVWGENVHLGIMPVGSGNGLARSAGISMKPSEAFEILHKGKLQATDAFSVNGHFACMLSGVGLDAEVAERFSHSHSRGLITYTTQTLIQFFKAHPVNFEVTVDGFTFCTDAFFISLANSNQFGNEVTIAPLASLNDGLLDVVIVQKMSKLSLPIALLKQLRQNEKMKNWVEKIGKETILYFQTPEIKIGNPLHAPLHIDGDPHPTSDSIHFKMIKNAFRLWVPANRL